MKYYLPRATISLIPFNPMIQSHGQSVTQNYNKNAILVHLCITALASLLFSPQYPNSFFHCPINTSSWGFSQQTWKVTDIRFYNWQLRQEESCSMNNRILKQSQIHRRPSYLMTIRDRDVEVSLPVEQWRWCKMLVDIWVPNWQIVTDILTVWHNEISSGEHGDNLKDGDDDKPTNGHSDFWLPSWW